MTGSLLTASDVAELLGSRGAGSMSSGGWADSPDRVLTPPPDARWAEPCCCDRPLPALKDGELGCVCWGHLTAGWTA